MKKAMSTIVVIGILLLLTACGAINTSVEESEDTAAVLEEEYALKLINYIQDCPLEINSYYTVSHNLIGNPEISVNADNVSGKIIDGFKVLFFCYSNFNEPIYDALRIDEELGYVEPAIYNGKIVNTFRWSDAYWTLYNYDAVSRVIPLIYAVHFADNTTWEIPEEYLAGAEIFAQEMVKTIDWNT